MNALPLTIRMETWPIDRFIPYARNPRKNNHAVDRMCASLREFGFKIPCLVRSDGEVVDGHLRLKAAQKLGITEVPVILCDEWTPAQVKAFRLMVNRSVAWANWDEELLALELQEIQALSFDLNLTGFEVPEIDHLLCVPGEPEVDTVLPLPEQATSRPGDLWLLGPHRLLCGDATSREAVTRLLEHRLPRLMLADLPYRMETDRAGLSGCGPAEPSHLKHNEDQCNTSISSDTPADWSEAFALVPSLEVAYVWHRPQFTREVLESLLRIGFVHHEQIIWNKGRPVLTHTHYSLQHEPCWYVRKKNAPWYGIPGESSTIWDSPSPKSIIGDSDDKFDQSTQKPVELIRRPIKNHTRHNELVYDPFLGRGTTLVAAELTGRVCCGLELDPKYVDVIVERWQNLTGKEATLEKLGTSFDQVALQR